MTPVITDPERFDVAHPTLAARPVQRDFGRRMNATIKLNGAKQKASIEVLDDGMLVLVVGDLKIEVRPSDVGYIAHCYGDSTADT